MTELEPGVYEECPICEGSGQQHLVRWDSLEPTCHPCVWCDGDGYVPHECSANVGV